MRRLVVTSALDGVEKINSVKFSNMRGHIVDSRNKRSTLELPAEATNCGNSKVVEIEVVVDA